MTVKIQIEKDTQAATVFNDFLAGKEAFHKAADEGKLEEYVKKETFATPLSTPVTQ